MLFSYPFNITQEGDEFIVTFPDVPEALTSSDNEVDAVALAEDALIAALGGYVDGRKSLPTPTDAGEFLVHLPPLVSAKLALYTSIKDAGLSNVAVATRLGVTENAVRRMLDLDHSSRIEAIALALKLVFRSAIITRVEKIPEVA